MAATNLSDLSLNLGRPTVTSLAVATRFGKLHKNVLRDIEALECSEEFTRLNFEPSGYYDETNRYLKMYRITRDGFTFLVMGFTGAEAAKWKEAYIGAFNHLEAVLRETLTGSPPKADPKIDPLDRTTIDNLRAKTNAVREARLLYGKAHARQLWSDFGMPTYDIPASAPIRPIFDAEEDGIACLNHLMGSTLETLRVSEWIKHARAGDVAAQEFLKKHGIMTIVPGYKGWVAIANNNETLTQIFAETPWANQWRNPLRRIDGARACDKSLYFGQARRATLLPERLFPTDD